MDPLVETVFLVAVIDATLAVVLWYAFAKPVKRSGRTRALAALGGAIAGASVTYQEVRFLVLELGYIQEAAGMTILFSFPFAVPITTGLTAWIAAEIAGGRSAKPTRGALAAVLASTLGAAIVFVPYFFFGRLQNTLADALEVFGPADELVGWMILLSPPVVGAVLGLRAVHGR